MKKITYYEQRGRGKSFREKRNGSDFCQKCRCQVWAGKGKRLVKLLLEAFTSIIHKVDENVAIIGFPREKLKRKWVYLAVGGIYVRHKWDFSPARFCVWSFFSWDIGWPEQSLHWALNWVASAGTPLTLLQARSASRDWEGGSGWGWGESVSELSPSFQRAIRLLP